MGNCFKSSSRVDDNPQNNPSEPLKLTIKTSLSVTQSSPKTPATPSTPKLPGFGVKYVNERLPSPRPEGAVLSWSSHLKDFTFNELRNATKNFRDILGEGGFGYVYKGWVDEQTLSASRPGSGMVVAVKKLKPEGLQGDKEWMTEVLYLGQLHHPNLVKLIGYSSEGDNRLLVYEFMPKGSLENHLFRRGAEPLSWAIRIKVAIGAARGVSFLHETQIIYRDLKAANILLDSKFSPKLSDFGLVKEGPTGDRSHVSTQVMGTRGYAAPEYIATGRLSSRADVYSFGVLLLELLSGRRAVEKSSTGVEHNLVDWAKPYLGDKRKLFRIMDTRLEGQYPKKEAFAVASLALQCLHNEAKQRPKMSEVLATLEDLRKDNGGSRLPKPEDIRPVSGHARKSPIRPHQPSPRRPTPIGSPLLQPHWRSPKVQ